jgi:hypothetical protein
LKIIWRQTFYLPETPVVSLPCAASFYRSFFYDFTITVLGHPQTVLQSISIGLNFESLREKKIVVKKVCISVSDLFISATTIDQTIYSPKFK